MAKKSKRLEKSKDLKSEDKVTADIPTVDQNAPLKIEKQAENISEVPQISASDELNIEKETGFLKEEVSQKTPEPIVQEVSREQINKKNYKLFVFGIFIASVIVAFTIGYFFLSAKKDEIAPTPTPTVVTETSKESTSVFNRSDWSLEILNGSAKTGEATKLAKSLESLGYMVVATGNADNKNYQSSIVFLNKDLEKYKVDFLKDLNGKIAVEVDIKTLTESTASARIIIGKN